MSTKISCPRCGTMIAAEDPACPHCGAEVARGVAETAADAGTPPGLPHRYKVLQLLGRGGMGRVYLCRDQDLEVDVAVKVLPPAIASNPRSLQRIESEAKVAARLRGLPGILHLYGFERHGESCILVMEYAAGGSVFHRIRDLGKMPEAGCRRVGAEVADALALAHGKGVLHRDIKPGNVLLDLQGRVMVADFGLARVVSSAYASTAGAPIEGTPTYMPPEIIRGDPVDGRADLYSLGVMLYEMATGEPPFTGSYKEIAAAKTAPGARPPDPRALQPKLSEEFSAIVRTLMEPDPDRRIQGAAACAVALRGGEGAEPAPAQAVEAMIVAPVVAPLARPAAAPAPRPARTPLSAPPEKKGAGIWIAVAVVLLLAGAGAAVALKPPPEAAPPPAIPAPSAPGPAAPAKVEGILVITKPAGATVLVDGVPAGVAATEKGLLLADLAPGLPHTIGARLEGYQPDEERGVSWTKGEPRAPVVLKLVAQTGILEVEGGKPGARVLVRRGETVVKDLTMREDGTLPPEILDAGRYELEVAAKGYRTWRQPITIPAGRGPRVQLELAEEEGLLSMDTLPTGAEVLLGERNLGRTPLHDVPLAPGKSLLRFEHPDASPVTRMVEIRGGASTDLGVVPLDPLATLDLSGLPRGVSAVVDGKPVEGLLRRPAGPMLVTFNKEGMQPLVGQITLKPGANRLPPTFKWKPIGGKIDLSGLGDSAAFLVAGTKAFAPPWKVVDVDAGVQAVVYVRPGAPLLPLLVSVRPGQTLLLPAPVFPASRRPGGDAADPARAAVEAGLDWLRRHQSPNGSWDCAGFETLCRNGKCGGAGGPVFDPGVTGLAVLALLEARGTDARWDGAAAWRGLEWLVAIQDEQGCYGPRTSNHFIYNQALATLAVIEGYVATGSPWLRESARRGVEFVEQCQNPRSGWRYGVRPKDNDTSITVWMVEALGAAQEAGIPVERSAFEGALAWLDSVTDPASGLVGYTAAGNGPARPQELMDVFPADKSNSITAGGVVARLACGLKPDASVIQKGVGLCSEILPSWEPNGGTIDFYYWYLGTRAEFAAGGSARWTRWKDALHRALVENQRTAKDGDRAGSWDPVDPWGVDGGRIYATTMNVLALEVSGRFGAGFHEMLPTTTMTLSSEPAGASVYLGDRLLGTTPLQQVPVPAGGLGLRLVHPEKEDLLLEAAVAAFQGNDLGKPTLPAAAAFLDAGDLPRDALCSTDGREVKGKCPVRAGEQRVTVQRPGFWPQSCVVAPGPGESAKPALGEWKAAGEGNRASIRGLPAPPEPFPAGFVAPPGTQVQDGRLFTAKDRVEMVLVPALEGIGKPKPAFLMDRHEVTVGQFQAFSKDTGIPMPPQPSGSFARQPVVNVERSLAQAYARWAGRRLPSTSEWERAAYGKPAAALGSLVPWPWGPLDQVRARNLAGREDGQAGLAPVAAYPTGTSRCGCFDMAGNAAEWVEDGAGPVGGSFQTAPADRTAVPIHPDPAATGFRCALSLPAK